ncbi:MAG: hypothetical protein RLZ98_2207 [Pseudomonadota bacterium]|jgi:GST-like protein
MIELHFWPTGNGQKVAIYLEEAGLEYEVHPVNINAGDQFRPEFLAISPNNRIPAIIDRAPADGGAPISVFESGAILLYLAEKTGKLIPADFRSRKETLEWMFWQVGGLGPMAGQRNHFSSRREGNEYAYDRYSKETNRLYGVLEKRLAGREYIVGDYSIADIMNYPWIVSGIRNYGYDLGDFPNIIAWHDRISSRSAVKLAYEKADVIRATNKVSEEEANRWKYGQSASSVAAMAANAAKQA